MNRELQRQQVKAILNELSDAAVPIAELGAKAIKEDWDEDKLAEEMLKALSKSLSLLLFRYMKKNSKAFLD